MHGRPLTSMAPNPLRYISKIILSWRCPRCISGWRKQRGGLRSFPTIITWRWEIVCLPIMRLNLAYCAQRKLYSFLPASSRILNFNRVNDKCLIVSQPYYGLLGAKGDYKFPIYLLR